MSKTNKKTQNKHQSKSAKMQNKQKSSPKRGNGQQKSGKQASVAAAYATRSVGHAPKIQASRDTCNIKHREFIGNISGSSLFLVASALSVNPGLTTTFPWLSIVAQAWEQYKFRKLNFVFLTRTGSNTPGSVIMSPDYDASDAQPATEQIMSTYDGTVEDAPWKDNRLALKTNLLSGAGGPRKFVRTGALLPNQDIKLYDVANVYVGVVDGTAVPWGKLWVEYDIDFWVPQLPPVGPIMQPNGGRILSGGTVSNVNIIGTAPVIDSQAVGISADASSKIYFNQAGSYVLTVAVSGTGETNIICTNNANCTVSTLTAPVVNAAGTAIVASFLIIAAQDGVNSNSVGITASATTVTSSSVFVGVAPPGSVN